MTVAQIAKRLQRRRRFVEDMLADWQAAGIAEEVDGAWRLTEYGLTRFGWPLLGADPGDV